MLRRNGQHLLLCIVPSGFAPDWKETATEWVTTAHGLATASSAVLEAGEHYDGCRVNIAGSIRAAEVLDTEHHSGTRKAGDR